MEIPKTGLLLRYIAAQGPLRHTCSDFWQMVWEQGSTLIIMLTTTTEGGKVRRHLWHLIQICLLLSAFGIRHPSVQYSMLLTLWLPPARLYSCSFKLLPSSFLLPPPYGLPIVLPCHPRAFTHSQHLHSPSPAQCVLVLNHDTFTSPCVATCTALTMTRFMPTSQTLLTPDESEE